MRVLFDQGTPEPLRHLLTQHEVATAYERGWARLKNGELLDAAEKDDYAVLVTTDSNLKHQQNLQLRMIAIVVLSTPSWPRIQRANASVVRAIERATPASYTEVSERLAVLFMELLQPGRLAGGAGAPSARSRLAWFVRRQPDAALAIVKTRELFGTDDLSAGCRASPRSRKEMVWQPSHPH